MLRTLRPVLLALLCLLPTLAKAAPIGTATGDFDNAKPDRGETTWGRLVADAVKSAGRADLALLNAGALKRGKIAAGGIEATAVDALLTFGDDDIVVVTLTGAQLRAGLERAVQLFPDGSPAFLHGAGFTATFNAQAPVNKRLTLVRVQNREVDNKDTFRVAMPVSLAEGSAGYYTIWNANNATKSGTTLRGAVVDYIKEQRNVSPSAVARLAPQ